MPELIPNEVRLAFLEYKAEYETPMLNRWLSGRGDIAQSVFEALEPWGITLENVSAKMNVQTASEAQLTFNVLALRANVQIGLGGLTIFVENPDWTKAEQIIALGIAVLNALVSTAEITVSSQSADVILHVQPQGVAKSVITKPLVSESLDGIVPGNISMTGVLIHSDSGMLVVDASAVFPETLFLRVKRIFAADVEFEKIAEALLETEKQVFERLGLSY